MYFCVVVQKKKGISGLALGYAANYVFSIYPRLDSTCYAVYGIWVVDVFDYLREYEIFRF
jgi:hypothetical protein